MGRFNSGMAITRSKLKNFSFGPGFMPRWLVVTTIAYGLGYALNGAMGDVIGEALGGAKLHKIGHLLGALLFGTIVGGGQWVVLQEYTSWAGRWVTANLAGYILGVICYTPVILLASGTMPLELELALTTLVPVIVAGIIQALALRRLFPRSWLWSAAYFSSFLAGWGIAWNISGGPTAAVNRAETLFPVPESAVQYALVQLPFGILGGVVFGIVTYFYLYSRND